MSLWIDIPPIEGVPDELVRVLNLRGRMLAEPTTSTMTVPTAVTVSSAGDADGTHAERLSSPAAAFELATKFTETDRGNALYEVQDVGGAHSWVWVGGIYRDVAAKRPGDLGTDDTGFTFFATDTLQGSYWNGASWVADDYPVGRSALTNAGAVVIVNTAGKVKEAPIVDDGGSKVTITGRHLLFGVDNTWDIGASGATRPRNIYAGTSVNSPLYKVSGTALASTHLTDTADLVRGAASLTTDYALPKISTTDGTLTESALSDDGTKVSITRRVTIKSSAAASAAGEEVLRLQSLGTGATAGSGPRISFSEVTDTEIAQVRTVASPGIFELAFYTYNAGLAERLRIASDGINLPSGVYKVGGTQVVTSRQADPGAAASSPALGVLVGVAGAAGATYTAVEQTLLQGVVNNNNPLNTSVNNLKTAVDALITDRDRIRTILQTHGLMA